MCLVDICIFKLVNIVMEVLEKMKKWDWLELELVCFNLEMNMMLCVFKGDCLSQMEGEVSGYFEKLCKKLGDFNVELVLMGILFMLWKFDLDMENLILKEWYKVLMEVINSQLIGNFYELCFMGIDEILVKYDFFLLEVCNISF